MPGKPTRVRIGPLHYEIRWENYEWERTSNATAQCDNRLQIIRMPLDRSPDIWPCAFVHEVIHALRCVDSSECEAINEEIACNLGSYSMVAFWRDNPDAFDWWIETIKNANNSHG